MALIFPRFARDELATFRVELVLSDFGKQNLRAAPVYRRFSLRAALRKLRSARTRAPRGMAPFFGQARAQSIKTHPRSVGARFAKIRCKVRRCILSCRAVSETLRSQAS